VPARSEQKVWVLFPGLMGVRGWTCDADGWHRSHFDFGWDNNWAMATSGKAPPTRKEILSSTRDPAIAKRGGVSGESPPLPRAALHRDRLKATNKSQIGGALQFLERPLLFFQTCHHFPPVQSCNDTMGQRRLTRSKSHRVLGRLPLLPSTRRDCFVPMANSAYPPTSQPRRWRITRA
jgi:hypothetical protein